MSEKKYKIDMTNGGLLGKTLLFVFPLLCTYVLQSFYNAVDMMVVGRFCSHEALAAIGATLNPITLTLKILIGLSTGANAVIAMYFGARDHIRFHKGTHTAMALSLYGGLLGMLIALCFAKPLLVLMNTPENILRDSCLYIWIYFLGIPFLTIFNFGCALLRAIGDSRRPLHYLLIAGAANVVLNLLFVIVFDMAVAGVALATTLSNGLAAALILRTLLYSPDSAHIVWKKVRIHWQLLKEILWNGIPAAVNSSFFNIANMLVQMSLNTFGAFAIAGCAANNAVEAFVSLISTSFQQAAMTIVAQNFGAKKYPRVARSCLLCLLLSAGLSLTIGWSVYWNGETVLGFFNKDPEVIRWGMIKMKCILPLLFLGCLMDICTGCLRGMGHSVLPAAASFAGACVFRILWVLCVFPRYPKPEVLFSCFPISWVLVTGFNSVMLYIILKRLFHKELGQSRISIFP